MTKKELADLGRRYCETRPGSYLTDVNTKDNTVTTYYKGVLLVSDADKVAEMLKEKSA